MKKTTLALCLSLTCLVWVSAQDINSRSAGSASSETSASAKHGSIQIENGTRLSAELQKTLDVRKAKVGDEVILKTTQAIKSNGRTVVPKGARLLGRVTDVVQRSGGDPSRIGILLNRLEHGSLAMPITATISSVTNAAASARVRDDDGFASDASASSRSTTSTSSGGLLGGVGGVLNSTTSAVGSTVNSTSNAAGSTNGLGNSLGAVQITQSTSTAVQGESLLSLQGGNLRLEKGTRFNFVVTQSANAGTGRDQ
jgi:hypothetical protein